MPAADPSSEHGAYVGKGAPSLSAFGLDPEIHAAARLGMGPRIKSEDRRGEALLLFPGEDRGPESDARRWMISGSPPSRGKRKAGKRRAPQSASNPPPPQQRLDSARFFLRVDRQGRRGATPSWESRES